MAISFFAKQAFLNIHPNEPYVHSGTNPKRGHLMRISSIIRSAQIAEYIGAKLNPASGYENDVCIYLKPYWRPGMDFNFEGKPYLDVCDSETLFELARMHPEVTVISLSDWNFELLKRVLPNKIVNIPHQHCNFERVKKEKGSITTVGCIGQTNAFGYLPKGLEEALAERGIKLILYSRFFTREDVIDFYKKIDVQIIWRPQKNYQKDILINPLKIVNSASFGIPTIAYDEPTFHEVEGCYIPVKDLKEFLEKLDELRVSPQLYDQYRETCLKKSENYHIDKIAKLYQDLEKA